MARLLYRGCTPGNDVALLQNDLNAIRYHTQQGSAFPALAVDGIFGSGTQSRVLEFQRLNGLALDGVVGPKTRETLEALFFSEPGLTAKRVPGGVSDPGQGDWKSTDADAGKSVYGKQPATGGGGKSGGSPSGSGSKPAGKPLGGGWGKGAGGYGK